MNFNNKFLVIASWIIALYIIGKQMISSSRSVISDEKMSSNDAVFNIDIDPNQKYENYSILQKIIYYFYQDSIDKELQKYQQKKDRIKKIPAQEGSKIKVKYLIENEEREVTLHLTKGVKLRDFPDIDLYEHLHGLYEGESFSLSLNDKSQVEISVIFISQ